MFELIDCLWIALGVILIVFMGFIYLIYPKKTKKTLPEIFAHRGLFNNIDVPENSMLSFEKAMENNFAIELDIQLTKDDQIVVFHDVNLRRMCGIDVSLEVLTYNEINNYHLLNTNQKIPLLKDVLSLVAGKVTLLIEYKTKLPGLDVSRICQKTHEVLKNYQGDYLIESFDYNVLKWYRIYQPNILRGQLSMGAKCYIPAMGKELAEKIPLRRRKMMSYLLYNFKSRPHFISYRYQDIHTIVELNKKFGAKIFCWTVTNKETNDELLQKYDAVISEQYLI